MSKPGKIDEWIKEAEDRPASALMILKLIAGRLNDLTARNEELLAENIALQDGSRVEEYRKRIAHLEYQLELLKRRYGEAGLAAEPAAAVTTSLLVYHPHGRILRLEAGPQELTEQTSLGRLVGESVPGDELPRLLAVRSDEELLLLFSSGRIGTLPASELPVLETGGEWTWEQAALPDEPHGGELLASLMPLGELPLSAYFLQVSRRGCVKKTMTSMAETILSNRFLGRGAIQKSDQAFSVNLCGKGARQALVTFEGRLLGLEVEALPYSAEERIQLEPHDHVVASLPIEPDESLLCLTQNGKVVQRPASAVDSAKTGQTRGQALISPARLDQGVRFAGACSLRAGGRLLALDSSGQLSLHAVEALVGSGSLPVEGVLLAFCSLAGGAA